MKICVDYDANGYLHVLGTPEQTQTCPFVITDTGALELAPFNISSEDGMMIAFAIVGVWAIGYTARMILKIFIYRS